MAEQNLVGAFLPTTTIFDTSMIYQVDVNTPEFKDLLVRLYQAVNNIALSTNVRDAGYYDTQEFVCGQLWFPNPLLTSSSSVTPTYRQVFRKVINWGKALPNTTSDTVAHGLSINSAWRFTRIYGCASDPTSNSYIPIPNFTPTGVAISVDATNVTITTAFNASSYTDVYVVLEYIKS